jgi:XTP/dITP diphosphohydrolase
LKTLIIATTNMGKLAEFRSLLPHCTILSNSDINYDIEIEETGNTLEQNAYLKAKKIYDYAREPVLAEDSGLFVNGINGEPGIKSARYAGEKASSENNIKLLLENMKNITNREAYFKTIICYINSNITCYFEGIIEGVITEYPMGKNGFGYDPIFRPRGYDLTFAQLDLEIKNRISHRAIALQKFVDFVELNTK